MKERLSQPTKRRLKRESFVHQTRALEKQLNIQDHQPKEIPRCLKHPRWEEEKAFQIQEHIPEVGPKDSQTDVERRSYSIDHIHLNYPSHSWTHVYTDGSAEQAVRNGGTGILIKYPGGKEDKLSVPTGTCSTNYKTEVFAIQ